MCPCLDPVVFGHLSCDQYYWDEQVRIQDEKLRRQVAYSSYWRMGVMINQPSALVLVTGV